MEKRPFFSVIIPIYNAEKTLAEAVRSVLAQTFADFEILLVDDASTDGSREAALAMAREDSRVQVVLLQKNAGAGRARNAGIRSARGEYLMFLDADDAFLPELMQRVADSLEEHPAQAVCWGLVEEYREENGRIAARKEVLCENRVLDGREELRPLVMELERKGLYGYLWNKAYRADYCREINVWIPSQSFNEDEMFNIAFFMDADSLNLLAFAGTRYRKFCRSEGRKSKVQTLTHRYLPDYYPIAMGRVQALLAQQEAWGRDTPKIREELAEIYLRYLTSALERNCDRRQRMNLWKRRRFVKMVWKSKLWRELIPYAHPAHPAYRMILTGSRYHMIWPSLTVGRAVHVVKKYRPDDFLREAAVPDTGKAGQKR